MKNATIISDGQSGDVGQRRLVAVLFVDMVGYTAAVTRLGEERSLALVRTIYDTLSQLVEENGGAVRDFAGDSIMGLFGIPEALEDPALCASRAALAIHAAFASNAADFYERFGMRPIARIGISSGNVVMAAVQSDDSPATAVGSTVNLASRLEELAPPGGTLICEATQQLVGWVTDLSFFEEHQIKGIEEPQKIWKLQALRDQATRFDASVAKGLSSYVGRAHELGVLSQALAQSQNTKQIIDLVAEPGLGKTRLVFEFLQQLAEDDALVLKGYCFSDGQRAPFLPLAEIVRKSFHIKDDDDPDIVSEKLTSGLMKWGRYSDENLGLLLNFLGLKAPAGTLDGLDGVLIGLRIRALLPDLLSARCEGQKVVLLIEDSHWIDTASEEVIGNLVRDTGLKNLLIIQTRRPEYRPGWLDDSCVTSVALHPLAAEDITHLAEYRLGVAALPDGLAEQLSERAGGNPLFGEEILSFLLDQGALRIDDGTAYFDVQQGASGLPSTMRSLLTARLEQLEPEDQILLQSAAVVGRRFSPGLVAQVAETSGDPDASLQRLLEQGVLYREENSSDYIFKHVLLRDSVYQSLVTARRSALHLAIADALAARAGNRPEETAETIAFHYGQTDRTDQAFRFSALAGEKSLGIYSLNEANNYFMAALELHQSDPDCATKEQFVALLANFALCSNLSLQVNQIIALSGSVRPILAQIGDDRHHALFLHHYIACLVCNGKYRMAHLIQQELTAMAQRLGDPVSRVYATVSELSVSIYFSPIENTLFDAKARETENSLKDMDDAYIQNFFLATLGWNELTRGRVALAHAEADRMIVVGKAKNDPRALGYGTAMKALIALVTDNYQVALQMAEEAHKASKVEFEHAIAEAARVGAMVPLEKPGAIDVVKQHIRSCDEKGWALFTFGPATMLGVAYALQGQITDGLRQLETAIQKRSDEGTEVAADWARLFLCEVYLAILTGEGGASPRVFFKNFIAIMGVMLFGKKRLVAMIDKIRRNPQFDDQGHYIARCDMIMGLFYKSKKQKHLALDYLTRAHVVVETAGPSPMLTRINDALADMS